MKQKARFKHFGNISYWPTNGRYISIGPPKKKRLISNYTCLKNPQVHVQENKNLMGVILCKFAKFQ